MKKYGIVALTLCMLLSLTVFAACGVTKPEPILSTKDGIVSVMPGESLEFSVAVKDVENPTGVVYKIASGENYATIDAATGVLTVKADAKPGSIIIVFAEYQEVSTAFISVTVKDIPVTAITATKTTDKISRGGQTTLEATVQPANATVKYEWKITEGSEYASVSGDVLSVSDGAEVGATVKVKAVCGNVESKELVFTVDVATDVVIFYMHDNVTIDKNDTQSTPVLAVRAFKKSVEVTDLPINFSVKSGAEFLEIEKNGMTCSLKAKAHGTAVVEASVPGTNAVETATVNVIVPPDALSIPETFENRNGLNFSFGMRDELDFAVNAIGEGVCEDYDITFSNAAGDENLASYADGKIKFNKTGLITVTATSKSGSKRETSVSYAFDVNNGVNVATYEQLKALANGSAYNGEIINIVNLTTDSLVPETIKNQTDKNYNDINAERINVINKNFRLKGNNYTIDFSGSRISSGDNKRIQPIIRVCPDGNTSNAYTVEISDLLMKGNNGYQSDDYYKEQNGGTMYCRTQRAMLIGETGIDAVFYPTIRNVKISGFCNGMRVSHAVNGLIENVTVENCYDNGIEIAASIVTVKDIKYKNCGAFGIEMTPDKNYKAGRNFDEMQKITFLGDTVAESDYNEISPYMNNWQGGIIPALINGILAGYSQYPDVVSNFKADSGKMIFYAFKFNNVYSADKKETVNGTQFVYGNQDDKFTVNVKNLTGKDTTHRFIVVDIEYQGMNLGQVIFLNLNYAG